MNPYVEKFAASLTENGKSQNTIANYARNADLFCNWLESVIGSEFDGKITTMDIAAYTRYLSDQKKQSLNSIKAKLTAVQKFADYLAQSGTMQAIKVQQKKGDVEPDVEVLEKNDLYRYLRYTMNTGNLLNIAIVQLILNTGIRASELCNLELSDLDITERKGSVIIRSGKGNKHREIPLNKDARQALQNYIDHARPADAESNHVFIGQRGAITRNAVYKICAKLGEQAIGRTVYPHLLRHQCFTTMAKNPAIDLKTISAIAGHSSTELTTRYYIHSSKQEKINAVDTLTFF